MSKPVIVLHGGAGWRKRGDLPLLVQSLQKKLEKIYPDLKKGLNAVEAAAQACSMLEDDPLYNAGRGSKLQSDGRIRMSASLMDGHQRRFSGCVNVEGVKNPIFLAKCLLNETDRVLAGRGAARYAKEIGLSFSSPYTSFQRKNHRQKNEGKTGTVGVVVLDRKGRLAAATSTGGRGYEYPHRVSDSPTCAGNFATNLCAVSATGVGEQIVEQAAAATICAYMDTGMPLIKAAQLMLKRAKKSKAEFGVIALDRHGKYVALTTGSLMTWAAADHTGFKFMSFS